VITSIIFDVDGTLINSIDDILSCLKDAYKDAGVPFNPAGEKLLIGPPPKEIIMNISPNLDDSTVALIVANFRRRYDSSNFPHTTLIDGVESLLMTLNKIGIKMFIVTNKPILPTRQILSKLGIKKYFEDVYTIDLIKGQTLSKSELIKKLIEKYGLTNNNTLVVGDIASDVKAGKDNNILSAGFLGGYGDVGSIIQSEPNYVIENMKDLCELITPY
jgi:phosphoglycolate phosphatase